MPYDKYRYAVAHSPLGKIEDRVLKDLEETKDLIDKYEILDSYGAFVIREYQEKVAQKYAGQIAHGAIPLIQRLLIGQFPEVRPPVRGRPVERDKKQGEPNGENN